MGPARASTSRRADGVRVRCGVPVVAAVVAPAARVAAGWQPVDMGMRGGVRGSTRRRAEGENRGVGGAARIRIAAGLADGGERGI